ncbi:carboxylesterase/lipase family protein [Amycolatopsis sp. NBRC 101858]|uniref:carboxylesterase/lipase family protein n=1 Tax=Amycolatopsis sp. NBRC 101858 TaxID=3032200 RepID=UPI0025552CEC|nr:carboxylesterase family protein [Amycolatopsis sp. NBRC 101858]
MRSAILVLAAASVLAACSAPAPSTQDIRTAAVGPLVRTADGALRGTSDGDVLRFRGVPYAQPPTGNLRWAPPAAVRPWAGERAADRSGPQCPQGTGTDEDCLHLDVTVPAARYDPARPRPVMVWLHGGGFSGGTGTDVDPRRLAARGDVVVVTVDFRIGVLGNLAVPGMTDGGTFGLQDQQAALAWVQRSAAAFGGDPGNVTLFGQSGGAVAVCGQLTSPAARGLFAKAILQSGSCDTTLAANAAGPGTPAFGSFWRPLATAERSGLQVAAALGCHDQAAVLTCLRGLPVDRLLTQTGAVTAAAFGGRTLPGDPRTAPPARPGRPVLSGTTSDEQRLVSGTYRLLGKPITEAQYPELLKAGFGADADAVAREYPVGGSAEAAWAAVYTDSGFVCPQVRTDDRLAAHGPVTGYEFADRTAPPLIPATPGFEPGASHAADLFYLFDIKDRPLHLDGSVYGLTAAQQALAAVVVDAWGAFAHTGTPGAWPAWHGPGSAVHRFTADAAHPATTVVADAHHCAFWQRITR